MVQASSPIISVSPVTSNVCLGEQFTIEVNLDLAENLYGYEVWLSFNSSVLKATAINYTGYLNEPTFEWYKEVNNAGGYVSLAMSSRLPAEAKTGGSPPPLAAIQFKTIGTGTSPLHLYKTILVDDQTMETPHETADGMVQVELVPGHDVAVTDVISSKTVICQGCSASFNVTVQDQGMYTETFDVAVYANTTLIDTQTVMLTSGDSKNLTFTWDNIDFPLGNCTIKAEAIIGEDVDPTDNTLTDGTIPVSMKGDINNDETVNIMDLYAVARAFQSKPGEEKWNPNVDLNEDQQINIVDLFVMAKEFGKTR